MGLFKFLFDIFSEDTDEVEDELEISMDIAKNVFLI